MHIAYSDTDANEVIYLHIYADAYEAEAFHENICTFAHLPALPKFDCGFASSRCWMGICEIVFVMCKRYIVEQINFSR